MTAITISRQLGSHGGRVARRLAKELGWELVDKSTINEVISQYGLIRLNDIYGDQPPRLRELFNQNTMWTIQWMNKTIAITIPTTNRIHAMFIDMPAIPPAPKSIATSPITRNTAAQCSIASPPRR